MEGVLGQHVRQAENATSAGTRQGRGSRTLVMRVLQVGRCWVVLVVVPTLDFRRDKPRPCCFLVDACPIASLVLCSAVQVAGVISRDKRGDSRMVPPLKNGTTLTDRR